MSADSEASCVQDGVNIVMMDSINPRDRGGPLIAKMRELKLDQERSQRIAQAGYDLVHRVLTPDNVYRWGGPGTGPIREHVSCSQRLPKAKGTQVAQAKATNIWRMVEAAPIANSDGNSKYQCKYGYCHMHIRSHIASMQAPGK